MGSTCNIPPPATQVVEWAAFAADDLVGAVRLELPLQQNTDLAVIETLVVDPVRRCRGIGTARLEQAARLAADRGRSRLTATTVSTRGARSADPGTAFVRRHGGEPLYTLVHNQLVLSPARPPWWDSAWRVDESAYEIVVFGSVAPDGIVNDIAALSPELSGDGQSGDEHWEPHPADVRRVRDFEKMRLSRVGGHTRWGSATGRAAVSSPTA